MKQRFSSIDVKVIAHELANALTTLRVSNIYDLSSKIFLVKFAKPEHKQQIIIDSGFRCHLTEYSRATAAEPSDFVKRLRKYLKTRRVTSVSQVGTDRIIEFQFSDGQYKLFLEFYASGNVILTDKELNILALLRIVKEGEAQEELRVGLKYSLENRQNYGGIPPLTDERLRKGLERAVERGEGELVAGRKAKKKGADALRKALAVSITEYPPMLVDHAMQITGFDSSLKPAEVLQSEPLLDHLMRTLQEAQRVVQEITSSEVSKGYILAKKKDGYQEGSEADGSRKGLIYDDFHPFRPRQFEGDESIVFLEFEGFNKTADEFFSSIEGQKLESKLEEREKTAQRKIEAARQDQAKRLGGLQEVQSLNERKAGALQANVERVQEAMDAVNGLIGQGMDWVEIGKLVEIEQKRNNPVASIIKLPLKLHENTISLLLDEEQFDDDDDLESHYETDSDVSDSEDESPEKKEPKQKAAERRLTIDIDLALSPWSNARQYYDQKRTAATKEIKTMESSRKALKSQEARIAQDLKKGLKQEKAILRPVRKQLWFEKFTWFISSDGYLVLGGKDSQQSEILYKRYLKKGDVYLNADIPGAASVIIRNNPKTPDAPIPPSTLSQAGSLVVSCSSAWDSKAGMSAFWANADQVSKSAPGGDFLPVGSFNVRGKKNFLPPAILLLGFGVIFHISEASKARHVKHRVQGVADTLSVTDGPNENLDTDRESAVPELDDDEGSEDDDVQESDEEVEQEPQLNPLQTQLATETVISDGDEDPLTQEIEDLEIKDLDAHDGDDAESIAETEMTDIPTQNPKNPQKNAPPPKRGKKAKAKKIATKYKDQDEEDRLAAQQLIGASTGQEKARAEAAAKATREAELAFQKERRRAQHQRTQQETAANEEMRKAMLEQGANELDDGEEDKMNILDTLVGMPLRGDEILEAIPICAPWAALGTFKYKAKLQPGAQKKGKAVKEIVARWVADGKGKVDEKSEDRERVWPREMELLKGWKVEEVTNTVPVSKVRVMMAGGAQAAAAKGGQGGKKGNKGGSGKGSKKGR
ncbi:Ribosome quality control complex subunit [Lachnellula hyalina]|uniref:Ribosome quality control complex subunit 2 n=1 Tax=Lachnellula hyalina TaxID=1316788 RepID=A0A8H8R9Y3_9HELO|nr:Ribosome quality control complex subunit [Lachnellula hyalina]TVY30678.1 Ribosome quality control complex subunit [Lachnellula hyalina]